MEKVIIADIDCLSNTINKAVNNGEINRALDACEQLKEKIMNLKRIQELRAYSKEVAG